MPDPRELYEGFREHDVDPLMTTEQMEALGLDSQGLRPFMTLVLLFGAAVRDCTRDEKKALYDARLLLKQGAPLPEVGAAILAAKGPDWDIPPETMALIDALNMED